MVDDETGRWLSPSAVAQYLGVRVDAVPRLVRAGRIPAPSHALGKRQPRWDRRKLDAALSGEPETQTADDALDATIARFEAARRQTKTR